MDNSGKVARVLADTVEFIEVAGCHALGNLVTSLLDVMLGSVELDRATTPTAQGGKLVRFCALANAASTAKIIGLIRSIMTDLK